MSSLGQKRQGFDQSVAAHDLLGARVHLLSLTECAHIRNAGVLQVCFQVEAQCEGEDGVARRPGPNASQRDKQVGSPDITLRPSSSIDQPCDEDLSYLLPEQLVLRNSQLAVVLMAVQYCLLHHMSLCK